MNTMVLLIFAFCFFMIAAFLQPVPPQTPWYSRVHLGWLGLAFWVATLIFK